MTVIPPVTSRYGTFELQTAKDVLEPIQDVIATLDGADDWPIWRGAHLASLTQLERDILENAHGMINRVRESVERRRDALHQSRRVR